MQLNIESTKNIIKKNLNFLKEEYCVKKIGVFGSVARGENSVSSDVDVLVEFSQPIGMFKFIDLEEYLSKIIGRKVDLVTRNALKSVIKKSILSETVYV